MAKSATEESDRMMTLLQELSAIKKAEEGNCSGDLDTRTRRRQISKEMKQLAAEKKKQSA